MADCCGYNGFFVKVPNFFDVKINTTIETSYEREKRLETERDSARKDRDSLKGVIQETDAVLLAAPVENREQMKSGSQVDRVKRLIAMCCMAEQGERDLRAEVATLREELALVASALASLTDRIANAA